MAGPGPFSERIPSKFRANSEFRANSGQFRANSGQASRTLYFLVILYNESPWLADSKEHTGPWRETDHARNLAQVDRARHNPEPRSEV